MDQSDSSIRMNEWMNDFLMSKTWEVFAQSSEPETHVKNAWQTKKIQNRIKSEYVYTNIEENLKTS